MNTDVFMTEEQNENVITKPQKTKEKKLGGNLSSLKPTAAFIGASWLALGIGVLSYCIGLWNANLDLNEKGYFFTLLLFGLFSAISVQKSVRDKTEGIPVTEVYYGIAWFTTIVSIILLWVGLRNSDMALSKKGFYGMAYVLALYASVAVQKNIRDARCYDSYEKQKR